MKVERSLFTLLLLFTVMTSSRAIGFTTVITTTITTPKADLRTLHHLSPTHSPVEISPSRFLSNTSKTKSTDSASAAPSPTDWISFRTRSRFVVVGCS